MELNLKKPTLSLRKPKLELKKSSISPPIKMQEGQYVRKRLATAKMKSMAGKMA